MLREDIEALRSALQDMNTSLAQIEVGLVWRGTLDCLFVYTLRCPHHHIQAVHIEVSCILIIESKQDVTFGLVLYGMS